MLGVVLATRSATADRDRDVRAIIITGAGRGFCSGLDLKEQGERGSSDSVNGASVSASAARFDLASSPPIVLHQTDKPVICALNGAAAGYGMDLALGCDIRIASEHGKLAAVFTKRGVLPESGGAWLLPRLVGWSKAAEIAFLGKVLGAQECLELGLVSKVVPADDPDATKRARWRPRSPATPRSPCRRRSA